jgi:hypothetical protein
MYLSAEWIAVANKAIKDTFEQSSVAWQTVPHWDTGDPGQVRVRCDHAYEDHVAGEDGVALPLGGESMLIGTDTVRFAITVAQALSSSPDALLDAVIARTVQLAGSVDDKVIDALDSGKAGKDIPVSSSGGINDLLDGLIDARAQLEKAGYRAPSCLLTNTPGLKSLNKLQTGLSDYQALLDAANINSVHRVDELPAETAGNAGTGSEQDGSVDEPTATAAGNAGTGSTGVKRVRLRKESKYLLLGRRLRIAHGGAAGAAPGEEPADLAVSVLPGLEIVGETSTGNIEMAVRIRFATRLTDKYGVVGVVIT